MLYRYPIEQKKTAQETTIGNRRYETDTGAELPPIPYIGTTNSTQSATVNKTTTNKAANKTSNKASTAVQNNANDELARQKALLLQQKRNEIEKQYTTNQNRLAANYDAEKLAAQQSNDELLRQLYIAYMQGIKNMPQQSALWGAGGEVESLKSRHRINYENNRARQNTQYSGIISELQQKYNNDLMELEEKYLKQLMNL